MGILFRIAWGHVFARRINLFTGGLIAVTLFLFIVGRSLVQSLDEALARTVTSMVTGDLQLASASSKDLPTFWPMSGAEPQLVPIPDFGRVRRALSAVENISALVPMSYRLGELVIPSQYENTLAALRESGRVKADPSARAQLQQEVRAQTMMLRGEISGLAQAAGVVLRDADQRLLAQLDSEKFWSELNARPLEKLEVLEDQFAPLVGAETSSVILPAVAVNIPEFRRVFDRVEIIDGKSVPEGEPGILLPKDFFESELKLTSARALDTLFTLRNEGVQFAEDPRAQEALAAAPSGASQMITFVRTGRRDDLLEALKEVLSSKEDSLEGLLQSFFTLTDENILERHRLFYDRLAPQLFLHRLQPGALITFRGTDRLGQQSAVNVRFFGTYRFRGIDSGMAGFLALLDLASFRRLYRMVTPENASSDGDEDTPAPTVDRASEIDELLMGAGAGVETVQSTPIATPVFEAPKSPVFEGDLRDGPTLHAAVVLKDPSRGEETLREIEKVSQEQGLNLRVVNWRATAGSMDGVLQVLRWILLGFAGLLVTIAAIVMSNTTVLAMLRRITELGVYRAIGASRRFIVGLVAAESLLLSLLYGVVGGAAGAGVVLWLGRVGIPSGGDPKLEFLFSGSRLYLVFHLSSLVLGGVMVLGMGVVSSLYPAVLAHRVPPVQAMGAEQVQ